MTYVVKDLGELAEDFRKKAEHLRKLGDGRRGHWPVKDRRVFQTQAAIWDQAATMIEHTRIEKETV